MKSIEKTIVWHKDEPGNHPPATMSYLVFGRIIRKGTLVADVRIAYHIKGSGFQFTDDMVDIFWAELPRPI